MKKVLKSVYINSKKADGTAYVDKNGNPFKMCVAEFTDGIKASMFIGQKYGQKDYEVVSQWQPGMEVDVILEQQGQYWNFKLPSQQDKLAERINTLENFVRQVCHLNSLKLPQSGQVATNYQNSYQNASNGQIEANNDDIDVSEIPF